jgi:hypothetical protein
MENGIQDIVIVGLASTGDIVDNGYADKGK